MKTLKALSFIALAAVLCSCGGGKEDKPDGPITPSVVAVSSVSLSKTEAELVIGNTLQLTATVSPSNATDKSVTWNSSNATVATVTPTGLVSAKAEGTANITASCGGKSAICKLTVKKPVIEVTSVELDKTEITLDAEETFTLKATVKPDNATDKTVTWASSKPDIATVDNDGKVTGVNNGVASVTATCCGKTASCKVNVVVKVKSITLSPTSATITVGDEPLTLTATISPDNAADKTVTWTSSNTSVATANNGVVTAVGIGSATITALAGDKTATCEISVTENREYVDLGLPSGIKWATNNIGATKPEEAGDFFAWSETESKTDYSWAKYKYCSGTETTLTKYCVSSANGSVDNKTILDLEDDVAHKSWGDNWRMPTRDEFGELINKCSWKWTTQNGVKGYRVTGPNNNSIFLPITGYKDGTRHAATTTTGYYWSSSLDSISTHGRRLIFNASSHRCSRAGRYYGMTVRPVYGTFVPVSNLTLNQTSIMPTEGEKVTLTATVSPSNASDRTALWTTSNASVATVNNGVVTAVKEGTANITARAGDKFATCSVTVVPANALKFTSTGTTAISLTKIGSPDAISLEYFASSTGNWKSYSIGDIITLNNGEVAVFRAGATGNVSFSKSISDYYNFVISGTGTVAASGNIMSLIDQKGTSVIPSTNCFTRLFDDCTRLTSPPELPATSLKACCYQSMFFGCTNLTTAPKLPATILAVGCYAQMFEGCTALTKAPELPATNLARECYSCMFWDCTSLTTAPKLPATILAEGCYAQMFQGCTALTSAPELPAKTLAKSCYSSMFCDCFSLTKAPTKLPATTLATRCYMAMFVNCTSLTKAPELPATTLAENCYQNMFSECTALTTAPKLPATTLKLMCYSYMFLGCINLTKAPELPATTLASFCYGHMFNGCTALTTAPKLRATILADGCYAHMFEGCTALTTVPELPATFLAEGCYYGMFEKCTALTTALKLPATTLAKSCYAYMFYECNRLCYVKALFTTTPEDSYTKDWLKGVAENGTFVKSKNATWDVRGDNGIPSGWTVVTE